MVMTDRQAWGLCLFSEWNGTLFGARYVSRTRNYIIDVGKKIWITNPPSSHHKCRTWKSKPYRYRLFWNAGRAYLIVLRSLDIVGRMEARLVAELADLSVDVGALFSIPAETHEKVRAQLRIGDGNTRAHLPSIWVDGSGVWQRWNSSRLLQLLSDSSWKSIQEGKELMSDLRHTDKHQYQFRS